MSSTILKFPGKISSALKVEIGEPVSIGVFYQRSHYLARLGQNYNC